MITYLKSKIKFLRDQIATKDTYFHEEINFLRQQIENALFKQEIFNVGLGNNCHGQHICSSHKAIDLVLTNLVCCFQKSCALEAGLSDFHKMIVTVLKSYLEKEQPKVIFYRDFGKLLSSHFRKQFL